MSRRPAPPPPEPSLPAAVCPDLAAAVVREYRRSRWRRKTKDFQPTNPHRGAKLK